MSRLIVSRITAVGKQGAGYLDVVQRFYRGHNVRPGLAIMVSRPVCRDRVTSISCTNQHPVQRRELHSTQFTCAGRPKNTIKKLRKAVHFSPKASAEIVEIHHDMTLQELADAMNRNTDQIFEALLFIPGTDRYDKEDAVIDDLHVIKNVIKKCGMKYKFKEKRKKEKENKDAFKRPPADPAVLAARPPVVTIMGHVDHGKTTLLDSIRHTCVVDGEFGGITQHIGAFSVKIPSGESITFLDTPGHAAFHAMRARGAHVTDLVVLVVAADDGVMKQTIESIQHAKESKVPIIVAINKIDKADIDIEHTKKSLMQHGVLLEDMGGDVQAVPVSALKGTNLEKLQEAILAQAEVMEIRADPKGLVEGAVIESSTDVGRGKLATMLVQRGTLRKGAVLVAGTAWVKVRGMFNDKGKPVTEAHPGEAVEVIGWREIPHAGEDIIEVESERRAHDVITWRKAQDKEQQASEAAQIAKSKMEEHQRTYKAAREERLAQGYRKSSIFRRQRTKEIIESGEGPELCILIKGDVDGSVDAIMEVLDTYDSEQCRLQILSYGVGAVSDHDVEMATTFNGIVYAFNVGLTPGADRKSRSARIDIRQHNIIYKMIDDLREELFKRLPPLKEENIIGEANVLQKFVITEKNRKQPVAGCRCTKGQLFRNKRFKLMRDGEVILDGELASLRHFKNEVDSIKVDVECGLMFKDHSIEALPGDTILCYEMVNVPQELEWDTEF